MCSLAGDVILEEILADKNILKQCKKCQLENPAIVLRNKDVYCKSCFLAATTHKFRAMLGKYRIINTNDTVLIVHSVGHPSTALLHLVKTGLELSQHKRLRFNPVVLFIDENPNFTKHDRIDLCQQVLKQMQSCAYQFPIYWTSLFAFLDDMKNDPHFLKIDPSNTFNEDVLFIKPYLTKISDSAHYNDIIRIARAKLITSIAKKLLCKVAFTSEISVDIAVEMLSSIALGRGSQIPQNVGVCDDRDTDVKIFRPLRLFEIKELAYYNIFHKLDPIVVQFENKEQVFSNVQSLMSKFVEGLQDNYPSTVNTITRTGDKLQTKTSDRFCKFCKSPVDTLPTLSSNEATNFSHWVSCQNSINIEDFVNTECDEHNYCFSCKKLVNSVGKHFFV